MFDVGVGIPLAIMAAWIVFTIVRSNRRVNRILDEEFGKRTLNEEKGNSDGDEVDPDRG